MSPSLNIFIVENHEDTLFHLARYLEMRGHVVRSATTMAAAIRYLSQASPDVLISDIGLPDGDGWALMSGLSHPKPFGIAISGYGTQADLRKSREAGFQHHLIKPFDPGELDAVLAKAA